MFSHSAAHVTVLHANYAILHKEPDEPKSQQKSVYRGEELILNKERVMLPLFASIVTLFHCICSEDGIILYHCTDSLLKIDTRFPQKIKITKIHVQHLRASEPHLIIKIIP